LAISKKPIRLPDKFARKYCEKGLMLAYADAVRLQPKLRVPFVGKGFDESRAATALVDDSPRTEPLTPLLSRHGATRCGPAPLRGRKIFFMCCPVIWAPTHMAFLGLRVRKMSRAPSTRWPGFLYAL
jgi:hypothetical protein